MSKLRRVKRQGDNIYPIKFKRPRGVGLRKAKRVYRAIQDKKKDVKNEFTVDSNTLMSKYDAVLDFKEHNVRVPWPVLLELDKNKKGGARRNMNARRAIGLFTRLIESVPMEKIHDGIPLVRPDEYVYGKIDNVGKLFFGIPDVEVLKKLLNRAYPDQEILLEFLENKEHYTKHHPESERDFILVSNDKVMRILALLVGIPAEDFLDDAVDEDKVSATGVHEFPNTFWEHQTGTVEESGLNADSRKCLRTFKHRRFRDVYINDFVNIEGDGKNKKRSFLVQDKPSSEIAILQELTNYCAEANKVFGINALNDEHNRALNVLMKPGIQVVLIEGVVGSGKDMLALAAGYQQIFESLKYSSIVASRVPVAVGSDPGLFPGSMHQKLKDWMMGISSNQKILTETYLKQLFPGEKKVPPKEYLLRKVPHESDSKKQSGKGAKETVALELKRVGFRTWSSSVLEYVSIAVLRGMSFYDEYVVLDEGQNCKIEELKLLLTRLGKNAKIVILGSFGQSDQFSIFDRDLPFAKVLEKSIGVKGVARVRLTKTVRHELAAYYDKVL